MTTLEEAFEIYKTGIVQRKTATTSMNEDSSRSHLIFAVIVRTQNNQTGQRSYSKISFCDLAGSEKVNKANPTIAQLNEGKAINQSLSALREIIRTLSTNGQNQGEFIPYRRNKLTQLMKDSVGGNSKTLMFVNISPADYNAQESRMSLFFGVNAKQIKNQISKNVESQEVAKLKEELARLRKKFSDVTTLATGGGI